MSAEDPQRVLIVDDHPDTTEILSVMFTLLGHQARCAPRGREALKAVREFDPQLVMLDIGLPDINGYEVAHALRASTRTQGRYIVALTGWGRPEDIAKAKRAGFDDHFLKPIDLRKIRDILRVTSERARRHRAATAN